MNWFDQVAIGGGQTLDSFMIAPCVALSCHHAKPTLQEAQIFVLSPCHLLYFVRPGYLIWKHTYTQIGTHLKYYPKKKQKWYSKWRPCNNNTSHVQGCMSHNWHSLDKCLKYFAVGPYFCAAYNSSQTLESSNTIRFLWRFQVFCQNCKHLGVRTESQHIWRTQA